MTDFDFEELDKAVNGLLNPDDTPAQAPQPVTSTDPTPHASPAAARSAAVEFDTKTEDTKANPDSFEKPARSAVPVPSQGRFMDMVHPSSDMRASSGSPIPPIPPVPPKTPTNLSHTVSRPFSVPSAPPTQEVQEDMAKEPLGSPFLPGAQVEKRPLGGTAGSFTPPAETREASQQEEQPNEKPSETPPESTHEPLEQHLLEADSAGEEELLLTEHASTHDELGEDTFPAQTSISQQYEESPPATPEETGAVYDTQAYHQALTTPPKNRTGLWLVVWIVGLILLGGAAGAAVYLFVLPML